MNVPCPTHRSRRAHRGCHFCRRPICRLCEVKMRGHIYCSTRCAREAGHAAWRSWLRSNLARPVPSAAAVVLVLLIAGAPTLAALRAVAELDRLNAPPAFAPRPRPASARIETVTSAPEGNRIEGSASAGTAVFLFAGGQFAGAAFSDHGRFRFENIRAAGPYRVGALFLSSESPLALSAQAPASASPAPAAELSPIDIGSRPPPSRDGDTIIPDF